MQKSSTYFNYKIDLKELVDIIPDEMFNEITNLIFKKIKVENEDAKICTGIDYNDCSENKLEFGVYD